MDFNHHLPKEDITNTPTRHVHGKCNKHCQRRNTETPYDIATALLRQALQGCSLAARALTLGDWKNLLLFFFS
jgi:hypothetical protein